MPDFSIRSNQKELLDRDDIPFEDISRNMQELEFINRNLGGHMISITGLKKLLKNYSHPKKLLHICEIGCGGGDNLLAIYRYGLKKKMNLRFTGIDINKDCIQHAKLNCKGPAVDWINSDYRDVQFNQQPDIIFTSLFCHHFNNEQLIHQLKWMFNHSALGFFINDLHRNKIAYYSIKILTKIFSNSYLVKNDAPLSVLRGFSKSDWLSITKEAGCENCSIQWKWAFRWLVTHVKNQH